jgi:hypothetical protein
MPPKNPVWHGAGLEGSGPFLLTNSRNWLGPAMDIPTALAVLEDAVKRSLTENSKQRKF